MEKIPECFGTYVGINIIDTIAINKNGSAIIKKVRLNRVTLDIYAIKLISTHERNQIMFKARKGSPNGYSAGMDMKIAANILLMTRSG
jgi:hypothetical protein